MIERSKRRIPPQKHRKVPAAVFFLVVATILELLSSEAMALLSLRMAAPSSGKGRVAVVTGASRGIGRGIALELGSAGYKVYCLGRSSRRARQTIDFQRPVAEGLDLTVESAAEEITKRGGVGVASCL